MKKEVIVSQLDKENYLKIRENINRFLTKSAQTFDKKGILILDIAPQIHVGAKGFFKKSTISTFDIDPTSKATYTGDITKYNKILPDNFFDIIVCTEVLEHTLDPFGAIKEIFRTLKPAGILLLSTPFNFRIHGPLPDCWRFTTHGLKVLLTNFSSIKINELATVERDLMPLHYTVIAKK